MAGAGPCTATETRAVVVAFVTAWSRGDTGAIDRIVAREPGYRWVSFGLPDGRSGPAAFDRGSLRRFVAARHARHDVMVLKSFRFNGSDVREGGGFGHFELVVQRRADDWPAGLPHPRPGKGAVICTGATRGLAVWSLG